MSLKPQVKTAHITMASWLHLDAAAKEITVRRFLPQESSAERR